MTIPPSKRRVYRFGAFEVDADAGEMRKGGIRIRIQEQPLRLLTALMERPGELITREELRSRLWPDDTWQRAHIERPIRSVRRECVDHLIRSVVFSIVTSAWLPEESSPEKTIRFAWL